MKTTMSKCLQVGFLTLLTSAVLLLYFVNSSEVSEIWSEIVRMIKKTTFITGRAPSNGYFIASGLQLAPSGKQCPPETPYLVTYPCKYYYSLNESERCQNEKPFLVLMVPVTPNNREARDAVRTTWGSERMVMDKVVSLFFLLGQPGHEGREEIQQKILQESEEHHDIIQSDFLDSYKNLTIKTMVIMEWLATYCQNAVYAIKIDSDIFLNVNTLMNMLLQAPRENYMTGLVTKMAAVSRNPSSKWYLPKDLFPEDIFPTYVLGLGYVLSLDLPNKLIEGAKHVKPIYIEDVFLGLCMWYLGIPFTSQADQSLFNVVPVPYSQCRYSKLIATTTHSLQDQVKFWKGLKKPGPPC